MYKYTLFTVAIWTTDAALAFVAGHYQSLAFAPVLSALGFWATMRMLRP